MKAGAGPRCGKLPRAQQASSTSTRRSSSWPRTRSSRTRACARTWRRSPRSSASSTQVRSQLGADAGAGPVRRGVPEQPHDPDVQEQARRARDRARQRRAALPARATATCATSTPRSATCAARSRGEQERILGKQTVRKNELHTELQRNVFTIEALLADAQAREPALQRRLKTTQKRLRRLRDERFTIANLQQEADQKKYAFDLYWKKHEEARTVEAMAKQSMVSVSVVQHATPPLEPENGLLMPLLLGLIGGLGLGHRDGGRGRVPEPPAALRGGGRALPRAAGARGDPRPRARRRTSRAHDTRESHQMSRIHDALKKLEAERAGAAGDGNGTSGNGNGERPRWQRQRHGGARWQWLLSGVRRRSATAAPRRSTSTLGPGGRGGLPAPRHEPARRARPACRPSSRSSSASWRRGTARAPPRPRPSSRPSWCGAAAAGSRSSRPTSARRPSTTVFGIRAGAGTRRADRGQGDAGRRRPGRPPCRTCSRSRPAMQRARRGRPVRLARAAGGARPAARAVRLRDLRPAAGQRLRRRPHPRAAARRRPHRDRGRRARASPRSSGRAAPSSASGCGSSARC